MSFITDLEELVDEVSDWASDTIQNIVSLLSPDGKPFGVEELSDDEALEAYLMIRNNPDAWLNFINEKATYVINRLTQEGLGQDSISAVHPYDIAINYAYRYSAEMESLYRKRGGFVLEGSEL